MKFFTCFPITFEDPDLLGFFITLKIYNITGREIATLVNEKLNPGIYEVDWNASQYPSGIYFYKIEANGNNQNFTKTMKALLIK